MNERASIDVPCRGIAGAMGGGGDRTLVLRREVGGRAVLVSCPELFQGSIYLTHEAAALLGNLLAALSIPERTDS